MKKQSNAATFDLVHNIFIDENKKSISEKTDLIPEIIARQITDNESEVSYLINRAEIHFHHSKHFRDSITAKGNKGRDNLYMFMDHWLKSFKLKNNQN